MKKLLSTENPFILANIKEILEQAGIPCSIKNEFVAGASGELPHFELWPELWLLRDADYLRAETIVQEINNNSEQEDWTCSGCQEKNAGSFDFCWKCGNGPTA